MGNLPGTIRNVSGQDHKCNKHPEEEALFRLQGETDSFGAEYIYMCTECSEEYAEELERSSPEYGTCDLCHMGSELQPYRDPDEGHNGPVYQACIHCRSLDDEVESEVDDEMYNLIFDEDETGIYMDLDPNYNY